MTRHEHVVYYHANCADGFGAAFAAWVKLGVQAEYVACNYGEAPPALEQCTDRHVHVLDFSFPPQVMDALRSRAASVTWLDHHKTAFEALGLDVNTPYVERGQNYIYSLDNGRSGALIAWQHYHPSYDVPELILCIDDRDRWQFKLPNSRAVNAALWSEAPWSFEQWLGYTHMVHNNALAGLVMKGEVLLKNQAAQVQQLLSGVQPCRLIPPLITSAESYRDPWVWSADNVCHAPGMALNSPLHISELGHEVAKLSGTYGLIWSVGEAGRVRCSLRSEGDYDVSRLARLFGGGGHRNAAGFELSLGRLMEFLA